MGAHTSIGVGLLTHILIHGVMISVKVGMELLARVEQLGAVCLEQ